MESGRDDSERNVTNWQSAVAYPVENFKRRNSSRRLSSSTRKPGQKRSNQMAGNSVPFKAVDSFDGIVPEPVTRQGRKNVIRTEMTPSAEGMGGPEFLHKSRLPSIRLKAPARKKAKLLHRSEPSSVQVVLLSGQRVEVSCRTDSTASDVFDSVVAHTNLTEHYFFGITILKDGEHFFLETDQKLHHFAPPGWRHQRKYLQARNVYTLYLRLKYYPYSLDYIKTTHTLHEMYLQLRRDIIDERLQVNRDAAYQLAALALQAEYGDRPSESAGYFNTDHYMPHRHLMEELGGEERIRSILAELHTQYSGMATQEAETEYLKMCQSQREYGIHFHRLYRSKPSQNLTPSPLGDPETGTPLWVGIMPRGIIVFEEQGGVRVPISQHPWHLTETLQFNRKKFVIVPQSAQTAGDVAGPPAKKVFYTDNYKKSSYFVKFAGTQHKFGMKMRGWAATLNSDQTQRSDSGFDTRTRVALPPRNGDSLASSVKSSDSGVPDLSREASPDEKIAIMAAAKKASKSPVARRPVPPPRGSHRTPEDTLSQPYSVGLGADGDEDESTKTRAINISVPANDRTWNITRTADESVSASLHERFDKATVEDGLISSPLSPSDYNVFSVKLTKDPRFGLGLTLVDGEIQGLKGVYVKSLASDGPAELQGRLRIGDKLLAVNGESLDNKNRHDAVNLVRQSGMNVEMKIMRLKGLYTGSEDDVSMNPSGAPGVVNNSAKRRTLSDGSPGAQEKRSRQSSSEEEVEFGDGDRRKGDEVDGFLPGFNSAEVVLENNNRTQDSAHIAQSAIGGSHLDWTDDISLGDISNVEWKEPDDEDMEAVTVILEKNEKGSLGIKIAGGNKGQRRIYIKALVADPALSCSNLRPGDRLVSVNDKDTREMPHKEVVELLRDASSPVTLGLLRMRISGAINGRSSSEEEVDVQTLIVSLEKPVSGSLGLSLARPAGGEGIYIRVINPDSVAAEDGQLKVGDRLWEINDESVAKASPLEVVEKLKEAVGIVRLVVKREASSLLR